MAAPATDDARRSALSLALVDAARDGEQDRCASLLAEAADPNVQTARTLQTPLFMACVHGQEEVAMQLMAASANVEITNNNGISPLIASATYGHVECVSRLIEAGADCHRVDRFGRSALFSACSAGHAAAAAVLLKAGARLDQPNKKGRTSLHAAAYHGYSDCVRVLKAAGGEDASHQTVCPARTAPRSHGAV